MQTPPEHILETLPEALAKWLAAQGEPGYRLDQVLEWAHRRWADSFEAMTNLPASLRRRLAAAYRLAGPAERHADVSADGRTGKLLLELEDGERIESVWMTERGRHTFCVSSQAGCPLGCLFCATGASGFTRDLTTAEILGQVTALARRTGALRNVVFMGMGEPLLNLGAVGAVLTALADPRRFGLGARHLTVSTAGITPGIRELADGGVRPNLALSLNSPFEEERRKLMPVTRTYPLAEVLDACSDYADRTGRRLLIEYVLLGGVNTDPPAARGVAKIARSLGALVNLIPFNAVEGCPFRAPTRGERSRFAYILERAGVKVTERYRRGRDISAACGQLRRSHR